MRLSLSAVTFTCTALLLTGCASVLDGPTQNVTIQTPGAAESECMLTNGIKYRVHGGEPVRIQRSHRDLVIECYATGDRRQVKVVPSALNEWGLANVTNGVVPGTTYDHLSGGLYAYPPVITVDFTGMPTRGFETPAYQNKDAPNPYKQTIENYGSSNARVPADEAYMHRGVQRRSNVSSNPFATGDGMTSMPSGSSGAPNTATTTTAAPAVPAGNTAEELTRSANPSVFNQ